jgi:phenylpropionate dioxygenase-like ring-hydroxylating dioxygenase large terminal subunit
MLQPDENARITLVGAGSPMGTTLRRYWHPALLSRELPEPDGPPLRVRLLGEDLIAFRGSDGKVGLVDAFCPHRRAPMFFGRNEECGLRCVYHGWKFDASGACVDMPSEPPDSLFKTKVAINAYPTHEAGGIVWTYMGPRDRIPPIPDFEYLRVPETHRYVSKSVEDCNWLQALEGGIDTSHSSFTHNNDIGNANFVRNADTAPVLDVERTDYGFRYAGIRQVRDEQYVRVYHYVMPATQFRGFVLDWDGAIRETPTLRGHFWVPIDDETTATYNFMYAYDPAIPLTPEYNRQSESNSGRGPGDVRADFRMRKNLANDYEIDRQLQKTKTFTGITGLHSQDYAVQEGMGKICDRTLEHLGTSDRAIITARQLLFEALDDAARGGVPKGADPTSYRELRPVDLMIPAGVRWQDHLARDLAAKF